MTEISKIYQNSRYASNVASLDDYGAVGDGVTDDTAAFTEAAAVSKYIIVTEKAAGYNVADTVVAGDSQFMFLGRFITTQLVGSATRYDVNGISINNGQIAAERIRLEPEKNTLTASNEGSLRGLFTDQEEPNVSSLDLGDAGWNFNEINCKWIGERTGSGPDGGAAAAKVKSLQVNFNGGGADFQLQSSAAIGCGHVHDTADTSIGDKLGLNAGVATTASTLGKLYGMSSGVTVDSGGDTPQAIGNEVDCFVNGSGITPTMIGFHAWSGGDSQPSGVYSAYGIGVSGAVGKSAWKTGITLYTNNGGTGQPIEATGSLMEADSPMTLLNLLEFPNVTVTNNILTSPNISINGDGNYEPASGAGIDYTASAGSLASGVTVGSRKNTHYEEGIWTPVVSDGANDISGAGYVLRTGKYTRIGNTVHVFCKISLNSLESVTGNIRIKGLPYNSSGSLDSPATVGRVSGVNLPAAGQNVGAYIENGTDYFNLRVNDLTSGTSGMGASELTASGIISVSATYPMS